MAKKSFFYRIEPAELLNFATDPEGEGMSLLRFAKELQRGESEFAFIQAIIDEANNYIEKKRFAGAKGGKAKAKASSAKAVPSSAKAEVSTPLASSSSSSSSSNNKPKSKDLVDQSKFDDEDLRFAKWMFSLIEALPGDHKEPNFAKWANTVRLMRERDGLSLKAIGIVFKWANNDDFWSGNILSPDKLRKKFSQLSAKALKPKQEGAGRKTFEEQKLENTKQAMVGFVGEDDGCEGQKRVCDYDG